MMKKATADSLHSLHAKQARGRLLFRVAPTPFESPLGYLCRVAHAHGYDGPRWLADLAGIPPGGFEVAERGIKLAHALRLESSEWRRLCYMPMGRIERRTFLGQIIGAHQLNYARSRICPGCLRDNPTWWAIWDLKLVSACPIHRCLLIDRCPSCRHKLTWHRRAVHECRCRQDLREVEPEKAEDRLVTINAAIWSAAGFHREPCEAEVKRVNLLPDQINLPLDATLRLIRFLGSVHEDGRIRRKQIRPFAELDIAIRIGIGATTMLMDWPRSFKDTLRRMANDPNQGPPALNFHKVFGNFYRHLFNVLPRKEFGFLHEAFESFVSEDWNGLVRGQHRWFSDAICKNTTWLVASEAENIAGTHSKRLGLLVRKGELAGIFFKAGRHRDECWIKRKSLNEWMTKRDAERALYLTAPEAKRALGLNHDTLLKIAEAGVFRCVNGVEKFFHPNGFYFPREDVLRLKHAFDGTAVPTCTYSTPGELIALRHGLKNYLGRDAGLPAVIRAVIDGTLVPVAYTNRFPGILGYLFRSEDLRNYRPTQTPTPPGGFLNYREAACMLETRTEVIRSLVIHGILSSPNEYRPGLAKLVPTRDVQHFAARYVDASILAACSGNTNHRLRGLISEIKESIIDIPIPGKGRKMFVPRKVAATIRNSKLAIPRE
jgi:hypothetical protein